eukprot:g16033.t1
MLDGMMNVKDRLCEHTGCKAVPSFNFEGERKGRFCSTHKLEKMVNVRDRRCLHDDCKTAPFFNYEGERIGKYCVTHKLDGMVNVKAERRNAKVVKNKRPRRT